MLADFAPVPYTPLPYPSILVASSNDPYCLPRLACAYARAWRSEFVWLQHLGHVNTESGHGDSPLGKALLTTLTCAAAQGTTVSIRHIESTNYSLPKESMNLIIVRVIN